LGQNARCGHVVRYLGIFFDAIVMVKWQKAVLSRARI
jgi:hypothetical protein